MPRLIQGTHSASARLLQAHLRLLSVVFVQKSLDAGPIVRMDIAEVLDLKINVDITLVPTRPAPVSIYSWCLLQGREDAVSGSGTTQ